MCYEAGTEVEVLTGGKWWSATVIGHIHDNAYGLKVGDDHLVATLDRMRTPERRGGRSLELTSNACARLAAEHGVIVLEDGSDDLDAQEVTANTILPNVWDDEG